MVQGEGRVLGDRLMVRRAITNLLSNAVRYAPAAASIALQIQTRPEGVTLSVSNPGEPIAAETNAAPSSRASTSQCLNLTLNMIRITLF